MTIFVRFVSLFLVWLAFRPTVDSRMVSIRDGPLEPKALRADAASQGVVDTAAIRKLAGENGIDATNAQLRVRGDTAWIWSRRDSRYSIGMELRRQNGRWVTHGITDTTSAPPARLPIDTTRKP